MCGPKEQQHAEGPIILKEKEILQLFIQFQMI